MKVIYGIGKVKKKFKNAVLAIGVFDGVHRGHQVLIKKAVQRAKAINGHALVMTFAPHPVHVLHPGKELPFISSLSYRLKLIEQLGVAACIVVRFTKQFSRLSPQKFIKNYLVDKIQPKEVLVGDDFRFGQNRSGTLTYFQQAGEKYKFSVNVLHSIGVSLSRHCENIQSKIGSTMIRQLISEGKLYRAKKLLGRRVGIMGRVVRGDGRGKLLGYPTINILPHKEVIPPIGVYAARVHLGDNHYAAMVNIGRRPSFKGLNQKIIIEAHVFNFKKSIYGKEILIEFIKKIRSEKTFISQEKLIGQLKKDEIKVKNVLKYWYS